MIQEFNALVDSTVRYWRHLISPEFEDEDIAQELRIVVLRTIQRFDPDKAGKFTESNRNGAKSPLHVSVHGNIQNRIRDFIRMSKVRSHIKREDEWRDGSNPNVYLQHKHHDRAVSGFSVQAIEGALTLDQSLIYDRHKDDCIAALPEVQQRIAVLKIEGYSNLEVQSLLNLKPHTFQQHLEDLRGHLMRV